MKKIKKEKQCKKKNMETEMVYKKRFDKHFNELRWLYIELYGNDSMFAELCNQMESFYKERKKKLKALE